MEIFREITSDVCAAGLPVALGAIIGSPLGTIPAAVLSSVVKQGAQSCLNRIHDDVLKRPLSSMQATRVEQVLYYAQCAYYEMIEKQGWELMQTILTGFPLDKYIETAEADRKHEVNTHIVGYLKKYKGEYKNKEIINYT